MIDEPVVLCRNVSKRFHLYEHRTRSLRELFIRAVLRRPIAVGRPYFALNGFNLRLMRGDAVAILGRNGSGKSTVLRVIAGIYAPTSGSVKVRGRMAAVIELGAGFHPELTGVENVTLYGAIMGLDTAQMARHLPAIADFADIGNFMDTPVKYYSSGMQARLAFAVAVCMDHDILVIDEVLAVGDEAFRQKCLDYLHEYRERHGTLVVAAHDLDTVKELCPRAILLHRGRPLMEGTVAEVTDAYQAQAQSEALRQAECREMIA